MSRATVDLQSVRFFLGYGLIFIAQSVVTILLAAVAMFVLQPELAAISLAPVPFVVLIANRYGTRVAPGDAGGPAADRRAHRRGRGERVRRARGQGVRPGGAPARRFRHSVQRVFDQQMIATRIQALLQPADQLPAEPRAGRDPARSAAAEVIDGSLSLGAFTAFYAYLLMLISPMRTLGYMLGAAQRATASGARIFQVLDREPRIDVAARRPAAARRAAATSTLRGVEPHLRGRSHPALRDIDLTSTAGRTVALVGAMGSGKTALVSLLPRLYDVTAGSVLIDGADVRYGRPGQPAPARSPSSTTIRSCSRPPCTTTSPTRGPTPPARRCERAAARRPGRGVHRRSCPRATTRASASAA